MINLMYTWCASLGAGGVQTINVFVIKKHSSPVTMFNLFWFIIIPITLTLSRNLRNKSIERRKKYFS